MKKPTLDRGPKLNSAIAQPQMMITSGVRHVPKPGLGRSSLAVADMQIPRGLTSASKKVEPTSRRELMHLHENPKRDVTKTGCRKAAMQISAVSRDELTKPTPGKAQGAMLYLFCS